MEGSEATAGSPRDIWMRRAGPFYGLLVAARGQTRLPLAPELDPTDEDRSRGMPWNPAVGAIIGLGLGFLAAILGEVGLATGVVAALLAFVWVVAGGGWSELEAARAGEQLLSRRRDDEAVEGGGMVTALVIALALSLVVRGAALIGIEPDYWTATLIVCPLVGRFAPVAGALCRALLSMRGPAESESKTKPPVTLLITTGVVAAVAVIAGGAAGFVALLVAVGAGVGATLLGSGDADNADAKLVFAVELAALLCFAASDTYPLL